MFRNVINAVLWPNKIIDAHSEIYNRFDSETTATSRSDASGRSRRFSQESVYANGYEAGRVAGGAADEVKFIGGSEQNS